MARLAFIMARPASPTAWGPLEGAARGCVHRHGGQRAASAPPRLALPRLACAALLSCAAALAACGGGGGGPAAEGPPPGEGLSGGERFSRGEMPTLTVTVGAGDAAGGPDAAGGSVRVGVGEGSPEDVPAGDSVDVAGGNKVMLEAMPERGYRFAGWTLSGGLACASGAQANPCVLPPGQVAAGAAARAFFEAVPAAEAARAAEAAPATSKAVSSPGGSVRLVVADASEGASASGLWIELPGGFLAELRFSAESAATLLASPERGYRFAGWTSGGLACASGARANPCVLPPGQAISDAAARAFFEAVPSAPGVSASPGGSARLVVADPSEGAPASSFWIELPNGFLTELRFSAGSAATLLAFPERGYRFAGWTLLGGLACDSGTSGEDGNPCVLPAGPAIAGAAARAFFEAVPATLTVSAGVGGSVTAEVAGADAVTVGADSSQGLAFGDESSATLSAVPAAGYAFAGWALSGGAACASGARANPCALPPGSATAAAAVGAAFRAVANTLAVAAGAGGSVAVNVASSAATVRPGGSMAFPFSVESSATLSAMPAAGYAFAGWTLSPPGLACAGGTDANPCALAEGSATADAAASAAFAAVPTTLTVSAGSGGSVAAEVAGASEPAVRPGGSMAFPFSAESSATLSAVPAAGYAFAGWTLSGHPGLACAGRNDANPCALAEGSATADATVDAAFRAVATTLTVIAGVGGSVDVVVAGAPERTVAGGSERGFAFSVLSAATLTATADPGYAFAGWTLSGQPGLACESGTQANICALPPGSATADATVEAAFEAIANTLTVIAGVGGSVDVVVGDASEPAVRPGDSMAFPFSAESSATLSAVPTAGYAFAGWTLSGHPGLACAGRNDANPCELPPGSATADAAVEAAFAAVPSTLTVIAGVGGSVDVVVAGASEPAVRPGDSMAFPFSAESSATLSAMPAPGYAFAGWTLSGQPGLACAGRNDANPCALPPGSVTAAATVEAAFEAVPSTLTVSAGTGGSVIAEVAGADAVTVGADSSRSIAFSVLSAATLSAAPAAGYAFAGWTLSPPGLACESGTQANICALPPGSATVAAAVEAAFRAVTTTLTVSAGPNGSVAAEVAGADAVTVGADSPRSLAFGVLSAATLTATADPGYAFAGWTLSPPGLACESGTQANICALAEGSVTTTATASAAFAAVPATLTVIAGVGGSVDVVVAGASEAEVRPGDSMAFPFSAESSATLSAVPATGHRFTGWVLSDGLACESGTRANPCELATGSATAGAAVEAAFRAVTTTLTIISFGNGSVVIEVDGVSSVELDAGTYYAEFSFSVETVTLTAVAAAGYGFSGWTLSPPGLACESGTQANICALAVSSITAGAVVEAAFRAVATTLTVAAGAGGSVAAEIAGASTVTAVTVNAGSSQDLTVSVGAATVRLTAVPATGYAFAGWTLSDGLACAGGTDANPCALPAGSVIAGAAAEAAFEAIANTLTVGAGTGGSVAVSIAGTRVVTVDAGTYAGFLPFSAWAAATLTAVPATGHRFAGWTLSDGLACESGTQANPCELGGRPVTADTTVDAAFEAVVDNRNLAVSAGPGGSVVVSTGPGHPEVTVAAGSSQTFSFTSPAGGPVNLRAVPGTLWRFSDWTLSDALECLPGTGPDVCELPATALAPGGDSSVDAVFEATTLTLTLGTSSGGRFNFSTSRTGWQNLFPRGFYVADTATVTVTAADNLLLRDIRRVGYHLAGWMWSDGLDCAVRRVIYLGCTLRADAIAGGAPLQVSAAFEPTERILTVVSGPGGSVVVTPVSGSEVTVAADSQFAFVANVDAAPVLEAKPDPGWRFAGWALSGRGAFGRGPVCRSGTGDLVCQPRHYSSSFSSYLNSGLSADVTATAAFEPVERVLTLTVGAGGSVVSEVAGASTVPAVTVNAGSRQDLTVSVGSATAVLTAVPATGHRFAGWTLSDGLACAGGTDANPCALPVGSVTTGAAVEAAFEAIANTLTVASGDGGCLFVTGDSLEIVFPGTSIEFPVNARRAIQVLAVPYAGHRFAGWTLSDGLACARWTRAHVCALRAGSVTAGAAIEAAFEPIERILTVAAGADGSVAAEIADASTVTAVTVGAGSRQDLTVSVGAATATLTAVPATGYAFAGWTLSDGLACAGGTDANPCALPVGSITAGAAVEAAFEATANTLTVASGDGGCLFVTGDSQEIVFPGTSIALSVNVGRTVQVRAVPYAGHRFAGWTLSDGLACARWTRADVCVLRSGSITAGAAIEAAFEPIERILTVVSDPGGSVAAEVAGTSAVTVGAGSRQDLTVSVGAATATLTAVPATGYRFAGWTLSDGLACAGGTDANPCALPTGSVTAGAAVEAAFEPIERILTVVSDPGGSVAAEVAGASAVTVGAGSRQDLTVGVGAATATLTAVPATGYRFAGWTLSDGLACAGGTDANPCALPTGSVTAGAAVEAAFEALTATLTVAAGAGGSVAAEVAGASAVTVGAGFRQDLTVSVGAATATLTAVPAAGYRFAGWTLSDGLACESGTRANPCALPVGSVTADATVEAAFDAAVTTLRVTSGDGGCLLVTGGSSALVFAGTSVALPFNAGVAARTLLIAVPYTGYRFAGWTLSDGLACAGWTNGICALRSGSVTAGAVVEAAFRAVATTLTVTVATALTVTAGAGGLVAAEVAGASAVTVGAGFSQDFTVSVEAATATLTAVPATGHNFAGWTLSPPELACAGGKYARVCALAIGSATADATVEATFEEGPFAAWRGPGSVSAPSDGSTRIAVPYAPGAFEGWDGAPCDGSKQPECDVSSVMAGERLPTAVFRPFVPAGIKSLAFGLGYHGADPDHFMVSFRDAPGAGFTPVPGLDEVAPGSGSARLPVSVHLLPWGRGAYLTEACDARGICVAANGGERTLEQPDSVAATGYFKAPNAGAYDYFGTSIALSADGGTLVVGAPGDDSASTGAFAPGDAGYQAALDSDGAANSGAVTVYRQSGSAWRVEAFVKAPNADSYDRFGQALALSADGATLAVGAPWDDSASTGAFAPGDAGYQAALDSGGARNSGAVTVYRRSVSAWRVEAFVKAPVAGAGDWFGESLSLSADGDTLAVRAPGNDSASTGAFAPGDAGYQAALDSDGAIRSGAVTVYRRSASAWRVEAFVKAPNADSYDSFGKSLSLSADGATLAVGAPDEDSAATGAFAPGDAGYQAALDSGGARNSGAVTVYRRSVSAWRVEAFVKAPNADSYGYFGESLSLSADGDTLAVGAPYDGSVSTGTFAPGDAGYQAALYSDDASNIGAVTVYRRSGSTWHVEAFVKASNAGAGDYLGWALALSGDGATLAVGARHEDSASAGVFAPDGAGYRAALGDNSAYQSGAVYVYRRPPGPGAWTVGNFVKASNAGAHDYFGRALALSGDGATLAVGTLRESGGAQPQPLSGFHEEVSVDVETSSGAVYLY